MATKTTVLLENLLMTWKVTALVFLPVISGPKNGWFLSQKSKLIARLPSLCITVLDFIRATGPDSFHCVFRAPDLKV